MAVCPAPLRMETRETPAASVSDQRGPAERTFGKGDTARLPDQRASRHRADAGGPSRRIDLDGCHRRVAGRAGVHRAWPRRCRRPSVWNEVIGHAVPSTSASPWAKWLCVPKIRFGNIGDRGRRGAHVTRCIRSAEPDASGDDVEHHMPPPREKQNTVLGG